MNATCLRCGSDGPVELIPIPERWREQIREDGEPTVEEILDQAHLCTPCVKDSRAEETPW